MHTSDIKMAVAKYDGNPSRSLAFVQNRNDQCIMVLDEYDKPSILVEISPVFPVAGCVSMYKDVNKILATTDRKADYLEAMIAELRRTLPTSDDGTIITGVAINYTCSIAISVAAAARRLGYTTIIRREDGSLEISSPVDKTETKGPHESPYEPALLAALKALSPDHAIERSAWTLLNDRTDNLFWGNPDHFLDDYERLICNHENDIWIGKAHSLNHPQLTVQAIGSNENIVMQVLVRNLANSYDFIGGERDSRVAVMMKNDYSRAKKYRSADGCNVVRPDIRLYGTGGRDETHIVVLAHPHTGKSVLLDIIAQAIAGVTGNRPVRMDLIREPREYVVPHNRELVAMLAKRTIVLSEGYTPLSPIKLDPNAPDTPTA